ncbi:MAG: hypothetical protein CL528_00365 [Aequorivita sp.]|jgi:hypothetical protein|nr:hypothetical protein [Aequorivita sp.]MBP40203.1 hypothetical protein [Aequorivita sp.]|tara:strand:- start:67135 stop:67830 length:696 start_codon:yes stop_codon:yes gene_type:complete
MKNSNDLKTFTPSIFGGTTIAGKGGDFNDGGAFNDGGMVWTPGINPNGGTTYGPGTGINPYPYQTGGKGAFSKTLQIVDKDGNPLVGAHLTWKDGSSNVGTTTDTNGEATINVVSENTAVSISYMGKRGHVATFANLGSLITLQDNVNNLPPVVVGPKPTQTTTTNLPAAKKVNWVKTAGIGIGALLLIGALSSSSSKKSSGLNGPKGKKKSGKKGKKRKGLREPATEITL